MQVAIVDDDPAVRDALSTFLSIEGYSVLTFANAETFLDSLPSLTVDVALIDLMMPGKSGMDLLVEAVPRSRFPFVMMSAHGDIQAAVRAVKLGAQDFIEKPIVAQDLVETLVDAVAQRQRHPTAGTTDPELLAALTEREAEVCRLLAKGLSNKEAARVLDISPRTVESHRARLFEKLQVRNIAGLIRLMGA